MKKISVVLFAFLGSVSVNAQKITLQWQGTETVDYGFTKKTYPKFSNSGYSVQNGNVIVSLQNAADTGNITIKNLQWKKIGSNEVYEADYNAIPNDEMTSVSYTTNSGKRYYNLQISALRKNENDYYRLESFEMVKDYSSSQRQATARAATYTTDNPLKSGNFYKIKVDKSGIFKITRKFLSDNGINVSGINPKNFRIYGNGGTLLPEYNRDFRYPALQEMAIQVTGEDDGSWDSEDYALFYAQGPTGFNQYGKLGNGNSRTDTRTDRSAHLQNIYEDYSYYFITFDLGEGKRIQTENIPVATGADIFTKYDAYQYINNDKYNLLKLGKVWVDDSFNTDKQVTFQLDSPLSTTDQVYYRISVVSYNGQSNSFKYNVNGTNEKSLSVPSNSDSYVKFESQNTASGFSGNTLTFNISPNTSVNPNGSFYFDYAEASYKQDLTFNDKQLSFRAFDISEGSGDNYGFTINNAASADQVWNVSDLTNAKKETNQANSNSTFTFGYNASSNIFNNEFVVFKNTEAYSPSFVGKISNSDLSSLVNVDYLVITSSAMLAQGQRIADYYKTKRNYHAEVVDVETIYNEFGSGSRDITAMRDFITKLKNEKGGLKYVLILGDASYDFKNKTTGNDNIVSSYQSEVSSNYVSSFVTDDYFVMTEPQNSSYITGNLPDLPVGRLPASNVTEAKLLVDKTLAYYNALPSQSSPFGVWRMKLDFVADDDADGGSPFHNIMNQSIEDNFEKGTRSEYNVRKLYLDSFTAETSAGGQRYPQVNQAISNDMGSSLYLFYFGHGGINGWAQERVLTIDDIKGFNNYTSVYSRFPLVSTITCEFTLWDEPDVSSAGEQLMKLSTGGAATMITSSRAIGVDFGRNFTGIFTNHIFELDSSNDFLALGDAFLAAKKTKGADSNHLKVNFLGDPAMKLSRPKQQLTIDNIETPVPGQIRALDKVKITGKVTASDGKTDTSFNGKVTINIFDKRLDKKTLNNDNSSSMTPVLNYTEEGSPIVKTSGTVTNGIYTAEFIVPKDINYTEGNGRILAYAENFENAKTNAYDVYKNQTVKVGGINPDGINDNTPPTALLYMNNTSFADGGITDQNPNFLACVTDDSGINSTGSGIGHDITVILDGEVVNTTVLNDFYSSGDGNSCVNSTLADYQKGNVIYPFRNLSVGEHQLTFKVWDINNNSTTATLNFVVKDESENKLVLSRLLNWPNPFTDRTYVQFEHNCDDILNVNVQIYTITGKLVRTLSTMVTSAPFLEGYRTPRQAIEWDGKDDFGDTVGKGTYIFKVNAKSQNQDKCKGSATAVEKMVLLK